jgi:hypothetical protein
MQQCGVVGLREEQPPCGSRQKEVDLHGLQSVLSDGREVVWLPTILPLGIAEAAEGFGQYLSATTHNRGKKCSAGDLGP